MRASLLVDTPTPTAVRETIDATVKDLAPRLAKGDVVLIMSNGGFGGIHQKLLDALDAN